MNNQLKLIIFVICTFGSYIPCFAQLDNVEDLIRGGVADAEILAEQYLAPVGKGFGADLNNGWYTTAKPHKFLGFDITLVTSTAFAPPADKTFDISKLNLQNLRLADDTNSITPTIVGDDTEGPNIELRLPFNNTDSLISEFNMPQGIGFRAIPSAMLQGALGVGKNTEVIFRFLPDIEFNDDLGSLQMLGLGVKHDLKQWLPAGMLLPFDLSLLAGYTNFSASTKDITLEPDANAIQTDLSASYDNQELEIASDAFTLNLLLSRKFSAFTLFGGVGFETSSFDIRLKGTYPITTLDQTGQRIIENLNNPIDISLDGANTLRATAGFRLNFLFMNLYSSYTLADYSAITLGLGFGAR